MVKILAKQKIIEAVQLLMVTKGYKATTVDEIINQAGVSKGSFYHAFKSKEELAIVALEEYTARGKAIIADGAYIKEVDPAKRALAFVEYIEGSSDKLWGHGCLLGSVAIEVADSHPEILEKVDKLFADLEGSMSIIFSLALRSRKIKGIKGKELSLQLLAIIEGSIITAKSHSSPQLLSQGIAHFKRYLEFLIGEDGLNK